MYRKDLPFPKLMSANQPSSGKIYFSNKSKFNIFASDGKVKTEYLKQKI